MHIYEVGLGVLRQREQQLQRPRGSNVLSLYAGHCGQKSNSIVDVGKGKRDPDHTGLCRNLAFTQSERRSHRQLAIVVIV